MDAAKRKRLEESGWKLGSAGDFLGLTPEESAYLDLKLSLSQKVRETRTELGLSQAALAKRIGSSQSRVAKMEAADVTVSVDLLLRTLLAMGVTRRELARAIASEQKKPAA